MGAADNECPVELTATTKRERQFHVVPMPGVFTRGRWKCWDYYRDESQPEKKESTVLDEEKQIIVVEKVVEIAVPDTSTIVVTASTTNTEITPVSQDAVSTGELTPVKESSTIVVTSIAPHLPTPQHGTPQSIGEPSEMERMLHQSQLSHTVAEPVVSAPTTVSLPASAINAPPASVNENAIQQQQQSAPASTTPQNAVAPAPVSTPASVTMARPSEPSPSNDEDIANSSNTNGGSSSAANIDNKIEQAMDLVKTHLTFAVREEIEVLKQTIAELEQKVTAVESENQLLRQYAPAEVISNLSVLVQQQRAQAAPTTPASAVGISVLPSAKISPPSFCSSALATTLNNVVADVRQQVRYGQPKEQ